MIGNIPYLLDFWAEPFLHLLQLKCSTSMVRTIPCLVLQKCQIDRKIQNCLECDRRSLSCSRFLLLRRRRLCRCGCGFVPFYFLTAPRVRDSLRRPPVLRTHFERPTKTETFHRLLLPTSSASTLLTCKTTTTTSYQTRWLPKVNH